MNNDKRTNVRIVQRIGFFLIGLFLLVGCKKERPNKDLDTSKGKSSPNIRVSMSSTSWTSYPQTGMTSSKRHTTKPTVRP